MSGLNSQLIKGLLYEFIFQARIKLIIKSIKKPRLGIWFFFFWIEPYCHEPVYEQIFPFLLGLDSLIKHI